MDQERDTLPWWKYKMLWLVISGPAIVVVAACWTGYVAMTHQDPVIDENYYQDGLNINKTLHHNTPFTPAETAMRQVNNHPLQSAAHQPADQ